MPSPSISAIYVPLHTPHASYKSASVFSLQAEDPPHPLHASSISRSESAHVPLLTPVDPQVRIFTVEPL